MPRMTRGKATRSRGLPKQLPPDLVPLVKKPGFKIKPLPKNAVKDLLVRHLLNRAGKRKRNK